jgi:hypothetical protein
MRRWHQGLCLAGKKAKANHLMFRSDLGKTIFKRPGRGILSLVQKSLKSQKTTSAQLTAYTVPAFCTGCQRLNTFFWGCTISNYCIICLCCGMFPVVFFNFLIPPSLFMSTTNTHSCLLYSQNETKKRLQVRFYQQPEIRKIFVPG